MARNFRELEANMPPERRAREAERMKEEPARMPLHQLRQALKMTQTRLALPRLAKLEFTLGAGSDLRWTSSYLSFYFSLILLDLRGNFVQPAGSFQ
jgi:hypothetical protein